MIALRSAPQIRHQSSIEYDALGAYFYLFGVRDHVAGAWLAWDDVTALADALGVPAAPVLFRGTFTSLADMQVVNSTCIDCMCEWRRR